LRRLLLDVLLLVLNVSYVVLWGVYLLAMFLFYWQVQPLAASAAHVVQWFRETFGILGFSFEAVGEGGDVTASKVWTFFDWVGRTIWRDFVSLSLFSTIVFLVQARRRGKS
jgi:hypothetical protein